ncbi:MAG: polysaccharide biosynthesis/export family protein [Planctomycetota bacterium]
MLSIYASGRLPVGRRVLAAALVLVLACAGCAGQRHYRARKCPAELQAPPVYNAQIVDLSRFSGPPVSSERIGRGDVLEVSLAAGLDADAISRFPARVSDDGQAFLPEIGSLPLAGLELPGAEQMIAAACVHRGLYLQPQVTVTMKRQRMNRITVVGAVKEPGIYELPRESSYVTGAIVTAEGLAEDAGTMVEIRRPAPESRLAAERRTFSEQSGVQLVGDTRDHPQQRVDLVCLDLANEVLQGPASNYLDDGTVIRVERRHPDPVQVIGLVHKPGQYDFPVNHELRVFGAVAMAGGLSQKMADKVYVIRNSPDGQGTVMIEVSLRAAKRVVEENFLLAPGDIVSVEQTPLTVMMDLVNFVRFGVGASVPLF